MKRFFKYLVAIFAVGALVFGLAELGIARANANVDSYIWSLENDSGYDFYGPKAVFIDLGYRICSDKYAGWSRPQVVAAAYVNPYIDLTLDAANRVVTHAENHLCP